MSITCETILAERLQRQRLVKPLGSEAGYVELFRLLQPVSTIHFARPGDPPSLAPRTRFNDRVEAERLRAKRAVVKVRCPGGRIGYVLREDMALYANAFRQPVKRFNEVQRIVFETLQNIGPLTPRQIKDETGLLNKEIMPALHRLQKGFAVYEDQVDCDWERCWYIFSSEWPEVELSDERFDAAGKEVLLRFLKGHVFATTEQMHDWSQFAVKTLGRLLEEMERAGVIAPGKIKGLGEGWMCTQDQISRTTGGKPSMFMLHKADILVRSHASELKRRFGEEEVLQYLLIDGEFQGAVVGHWRIGPHDVDDIVVNLPAAQRASKREEILAVVGRQYKLPRSCILRYAGKRLVDTQRSRKN